MLVKPQFELQPGQVGKGGIVRDPALYAVVEQRMREACAALGLRVREWFDSPIDGRRRQPRIFHSCRSCRAANQEPAVRLPLSFEFFPPKTPEGAVKLRAVRAAALRA